MLANGVWDPVEQEGETAICLSHESVQFMLDATRHMTKLELKPQHERSGSEHASSAPIGFLDSPSHAGRRGRKRFFDSPVPSDAHGDAASPAPSPSNAASAEAHGKLRQFAASHLAASPGPMSPAAAQLRATLTWLPSVEVLVGYDKEEYYEGKATTPAIAGARIYLSLGDCGGAIIDGWRPSGSRTRGWVTFICVVFRVARDAGHECKGGQRMYTRVRYESTEKLAWAVLEKHELNPLLMYQAYMLIARGRRYAAWL